MTALTSCFSKHDIRRDAQRLSSIAGIEFFNFIKSSQDSLYKHCYKLSFLINQEPQRVSNANFYAYSGFYWIFPVSITSWGLLHNILISILTDLLQIFGKDKMIIVCPFPLSRQCEKSKSTLEFKFWHFFFGSSVKKGFWTCYPKKIKINHQDSDHWNLLLNKFLSVWIRIFFENHNWIFFSTDITYFIFSFCGYQFITKTIWVTLQGYEYIKANIMSFIRLTLKPLFQSAIRLKNLQNHEIDFLCMNSWIFFCDWGHWRPKQTWRR